MINEKTIQKESRAESVGEMHKRRETMADERRYIIYYTFGENAQLSRIESAESAITESENNLSSPGDENHSFDSVRAVE